MLISELLNPKKLFNSIDGYFFKQDGLSTTTKKTTTIITNKHYNVLTILMIILIIIAGLVTSFVIILFIKKFRVYLKLYSNYKHEKKIQQQDHLNNLKTTRLLLNEEIFRNNDGSDRGAVIIDDDLNENLLLNNRINITKDFIIKFQSIDMTTS